MATWNSSYTKTTSAVRLIDSVMDLVESEYSSALSARNDDMKLIFEAHNHNAIENLYTLQGDLCEAVDFTDMGIVKEDTNMIPKLVKGEKYALKGACCDGFDMPEKVYELIGVVDEYDGISVDSVIVKQISGDKDQIFTLSKNDCDYIGIEYQQGLQLFPRQFNWKRVKDVLPFNKNDLGTTPLSDIDNTIRYIVIKLNGFKDYSDGFIVTPSGKIIKEKQFLNTLRVINNEPIVYGSHDLVISANSRLNHSVVYPSNAVFNHGNFISSEDSIYILIDLKFRDGRPSSLNDTIDDFFGVERKYLEGFNVSTYLSISWDELGAYTIEEYEDEKAKKEEQRKLRAKKAELELKKKIEREEQRIREERRAREEAINKMRGYRIEMPKFPKMPRINVKNISSVEMCSDSMNTYFKLLDDTLNGLSKEINDIASSISFNTNSLLKQPSDEMDILKMLKL